MDLRLKVRVVRGDNEISKEIINKLQVKWILKVFEWEKSGLNEKVEDGEVEFTLVQGPKIHEPTRLVPLVSNLLNFKIKMLILMCGTPHSLCAMKRMIRKLKELTRRNEEREVKVSEMKVKLALIY